MIGPRMLARVQVRILFYVLIDDSHSQLAGGWLASGWRVVSLPAWLDGGQPPRHALHQSPAVPRPACHTVSVCKPHLHRRTSHSSAEPLTTNPHDFYGLSGQLCFWRENVLILLPRHGRDHLYFIRGQPLQKGCSPQIWLIPQNHQGWELKSLLMS